MAEALILLAVAIVVSSAFMFMVIADGVHRHRVFMADVVVQLHVAVAGMVSALSAMADVANKSAESMARFASAFSSTKDPDVPRVL